MDSIRIRTGIGLSTFAGLLLFIVGCPEKQTVKMPTPAPAPTGQSAVVAKTDLENLRNQYMRRLSLHHTPHATDTELTLVQFRRDLSQASSALHDLNKDLKKLVESKSARVTDWLEHEKEVSFQYDNGHIHGFVTAKLRSHPNSELALAHWDIILDVHEEHHH